MNLQRAPILVVASSPVDRRAIGGCLADCGHPIRIVEGAETVLPSAVAVAVVTIEALEDGNLRAPVEALCANGPERVVLLAAGTNTRRCLRLARQRLGDCELRILRRPLKRHDLLEQVDDCLVRHRDAAERGFEQDTWRARMGHDLKAPLRQVALWQDLAENAQAAGLYQDLGPLLGKSRASLERMRELIDDSLSPHQLHRSCRPRHELGHVLQDLEGDILQVEAEVSLGPLPERFPMAAAALRRVLQNLIANALRYRSPRPLQVAIWGDADHARAWLTVQDNGIGIAPELLPDLFRRQAPTGVATERGGTGLGLGLCSSIVQEYGGRIIVDSAPDVGSSFTIELPLPRTLPGV